MVDIGLHEAIAVYKNKELAITCSDAGQMKSLEPPERLPTSSLRRRELMAGEQTVEGSGMAPRIPDPAALRMLTGGSY